MIKQMISDQFAGNMYQYNEYPVWCGSGMLHLDSMELRDASPQRNILLMHGVTYSSHEFDMNYKDYSLVRRLAREGYRVWRLDIMGYGQSADVEDGFMPDSDYAAENIAAAVGRILYETGEKQIDLLGWSWGTVTAGRFAVRHPEQIKRLVLYAPILCGLGQEKISEPFHHNTWEHAAEDFQKTADGALDYEMIDPIVVEMYCSGCWRYDGEFSPNGGRRDLCVDRSVMLIDLPRVRVPTLVICGDRDPYVNCGLVKCCMGSLPAGSFLKIIEGGSHVVFVEKPFYHVFQDSLIAFLKMK